MKIELLCSGLIRMNGGILYQYRYTRSSSHGITAVYAPMNLETEGRAISLSKEALLKQMNADDANRILFPDRETPEVRKLEKTLDFKKYIELKRNSKSLHDLQKFADKEFSYHWSHLIHALNEYKRSKSMRQLDHHLEVIRKYDLLCINDTQYAFMSGLIDSDQLEKVINAIEDVEFRVMEMETEVITDEFSE